MKKKLTRRKTCLLAMLIAAALATPNGATAKQVMCLKTDGGQYIELARVSMMAVADGAKTFEIVVKDGEGAANVQSISFEKHESDIDLSKYSGSSGSSDNIDMSKPVFLLTNTGKYFFMKELPKMTAKDGSANFDLTVGGITESDVSLVYFYRGAKENVEELVAGIDNPRMSATEEQLSLQTPISSQLTLSGCGAANQAVLYAADGSMVGEAPVSNGMTTLQVGHLNHGVYIVKVGRKSLKFLKK